tara:strand:+ start:51 stop:455 length:405 start_codon:yes stop_codon:yes gene_type:complete
MKKVLLVLILAVVALGCSKEDSVVIEEEVLTIKDLLTREVAWMNLAGGGWSFSSIEDGIGLYSISEVGGLDCYSKWQDPDVFTKTEIVGDYLFIYSQGEVYITLKVEGSVLEWNSVNQTGTRTLYADSTIIFCD